MKTSEVLEKAADLIDEAGWVKGMAGWHGLGGFCAEGAIGHIEGISPVQLSVTSGTGQPSGSEAIEALAEHLGLGKRAFKWNDSLLTKEKVTATMRLVAAKERVKEAEAVLAEAVIVEDAQRQEIKDGYAAAQAEASKFWASLSIPQPNIFDDITQKKISTYVGGGTFVIPKGFSVGGFTMTEDKVTCPGDTFTVTEKPLALSTA